jgi:hypothetical protein
MCPASIGGVAGLTEDWWVAHTRPRFEKAVAFDLLAKRIPYYLPLVAHDRVSGGRKRRSMLPLFPSYLFFCGDAGARYEALTTNRIVQVIPVKDRERFVGELTLIERALSRDARLQVYPSVAIGRRCRVAAGQFEGLEGMLVERDRQTILVLQLSMLGSGASLEIEARQLETIE